MKKKPVSIRNIADKLNISVTTVSFVLNGKAKEKHISEELTKKVLDYAKLINYRPNQIAQSLRTGKSKILVFMVEDISNRFFAKLARIVEDIAYSKGYKVIFCSTENDDEKSSELVRVFKYRQVDGFIIVPSPGIKNVIKELIDENIPVVLLDRYFSDLDCNSVVIDNEDAAYRATCHMINNQYTNIGFVTTNSSQTQMRDRLLGYEKAILNHGLTPQILKIPFTDTNHEKSKFIENFIQESKKMDAVFFTTNYLAITGLNILKENAPHLVENMGIITFDDNKFFKLYTPTITAVSQPLEEIGIQAMKLLLPLLKHKNVKESVQKIMLNAELIVRESSCLKKTPPKTKEYI